MNVNVRMISRAKALAESQRAGGEAGRRWGAGAYEAPVSKRRRIEGDADAAAIPDLTNEDDDEVQYVGSRIAGAGLVHLLAPFWTSQPACRNEAESLWH